MPEVRTVPGVIRFFGIRDRDDNDLLPFEVLTQDPRVTGDRASETGPAGRGTSS